MATRYWVGGSGSWNATTNWSATSGGAGGASIPISTDDVVFDANSGLTAGAVSTCNIAFTINNLTITTNATVGINYLFITVSLTVNGTMSCSGTAGNRRLWIRSSTYGIGVNLTVATASSLADLDFRDIYVKGTAAPISGTRIGNAGNCTGITFNTPKTIYWNLAGVQNWSSNGWCQNSGGTPSTDYFPLPQDTAVFDNTGSITTLNINNTAPYVPTVNFFTRTSAITLTLSSATIIYGNWISGSGLTISGTNALTFSGGTTQTITSAGKTFSCPITIDTYGGTVQLADALNTALGLTVTNGTFNTQGYALSVANVASNNTNVRAINLGASTVTLTGSGSVINFSTATNFTFNAGTSTISNSVNGSMDVTSTVSFYNLSFTGTTAVSVVFSGANTFNNLTIGAPNTSSIKSVTFNANQTINGTFTCAGASAVRRMFVQSNTIGTQRDLTVGTLVADDCDFRDIEILGTASGTSPTRAGDCGNNSGITFPSPKTVYWNLAGAQNWSATGWATSSGGSPAVNNFPLAQDTAVFDNTGSAGAVTNDASWNIGTFDASGRTSAMAFNNNGTSTPAIYGDWKFGTGVTVSSTTGAFNFSKNGTQTITSNGVQFGFPVTINNPNAYVQLADALSLNSARTLTLTAGTFDAVTYNVTTGLFSNGSTLNTLKMGSGTWTLSGTGTVWSVATTPTLIVGTSTIVLSDTSTTARTFSGGGLYYNKLTIGGTTGTSTLTINGSNTFGEIASTKTVAHTILFASTGTCNIGKWSVTGTAGNVVTVGPTTAALAYTLVINGPANTGIDYLSISYCAVSTTSPGELYVGANSTNTAGNTGSIIFTATPSPRTLYWVGGTGNWSSTTKWATSSGGVSGAAIPTSLDSVNFDSLSNATAYTATIDAGVTIARCAAFTMAGPLTGNVTFAGIVPISYHGNVSFAATGITRTYSGAMNCAGNSSYTFTTNGLSLSNTITINGIGSTWTLGSSLTFSGGQRFQILFGSFSTSASNYALSVGGISVLNTGLSTVSLNSSTITFANLSSATTFDYSGVNSTVNFGSSNISFTNASSGISSGGLNFYNVSFTGTLPSSIAITGANTFNNLTFTGQTTVGINPVTFAANQIINGTLTLGAGTAAAYRIFLASNTIGTPRTLTVNALAAGAADIDFRDIVVTGAAAPLTGTRFGDCKGNSGITFPAAKTVYRAAATASWGAATGASGWALTNGGSVSDAAFPLPQDTAIFPSSPTPYPSSGATVTVNANYNIGTIDMSARTSNTMTLATGTTTPQIYGNWINGTGITLSGTGTMTFAGRGSQTITSAGVTFTQPIQINTSSGSVTLQDAFNSSTSGVYGFGIFAGTLNANNYNVTISGAPSTSVQVTTAGTRTIAFGSGTWSLSGAAPYQASAITGLTITGAAIINCTSATAKSFNGGNSSYSGITLNQGGAGTLTISGNNTFANITNTYSGASTINLAATTQTVGAWTAKGTAGNLLTITGTSAASPATLIYSGGGSIAGLDYLAPTFVRAYPTTSTWYAGANSTNGGSLGWIFAASGGVVYAVYITESATALDSVASKFAFSGAVTNSATALDSVASAAVFRSAVSNTVNATDTTASAAQFNSAVSNTASALDTVSAKEIANSSVTNSATAVESVSSLKGFFSSLSETATAVDSVSVSKTAAAAVAEQATTAATNTAVEVFASSVSNAATATDTTASQKYVSGAVTENATAQDSVAARAILRGIIEETVRGSDRFSTSVVFLAAFSGFAQAYAADVGYLTGSRSISESSTAASTNAATKTLPGNISEASTAANQFAGKVVWASYISELATGRDSLNAPNSVYHATVSNTATALATPTANAIFYAAVIAYAGITDFAVARYLWNLIDDTQAPNWGDVNDTQAVIWTAVNDTQVTNWQNVNDTQSTTWAEVNDTQAPNWNPIE